MRKYIIKRLLFSVIILFFCAFCIYALMRCLPSSFVETIARNKSMQPNSKSYEEWLAQLSAQYNLDKGIIPGFLGWLKNAVTLQFGDSWSWTVPVTEKFNDVIWLSFVINVICFVLELGIAIPLGIIAATHQYSKTDYLISIIALAGISLPSFFLASVLKLLFSVKFGWFDLFGLVGRYYNQLDPFHQLLDKAHHLVLPIVTLVLISIGSTMRFIRTNMLEVLGADYIRTARAKGVPEHKVIYKHAFRNTMIPLVSMLGGSLPSFFTGAMITEQLFAIPGIGQTALTSMRSGDIPFTMFYMVFLSMLTLIGSIITDILYAVVDPRVRIA